MSEKPEAPVLSDDFNKIAEITDKMNLIRILIQDNEIAKKNLTAAEKDYLSKFEGYTKRQLTDELTNLSKKIYSIKPV